MEMNWFSMLLLACVCVGGGVYGYFQILCITTNSFFLAIVLERGWQQTKAEHI